MPPQRVAFFALFSLKTVMDFAHCGLKSCMGFERSTGVYKRFLLFQIQMRRKEKNGGFEMDFKNFFSVFVLY